MSLAAITRAIPPALLNPSQPTVFPPALNQQTHVTLLQVDQALPRHDRNVELLEFLTSQSNEGISIPRVFQENIDAYASQGQFNSQTKEALNTCTLQLLLLMIGGETPTSETENPVVDRCVDFLMYKFGNNQGVEFNKAAELLDSFHRDLLHNWRGAKEKVTVLLQDLVNNIIQAQTRWCEIMCFELGKHLGPPPCYLTRRQQMRLTTLAMLPSAAQVLGKLPPHIIRGPWAKQLRKIKPQFEIWHTLLKSFPASNQIKQQKPSVWRRVCEPFDVNVWALHQVAPRDLEGRYTPRISNPEPQELLGQLLTFLMGDPDLWRWGRGWEVQRRLRRLGEDLKGWRVAEEDLLALVFM